MAREMARLGATTADERFKLRVYTCDHVAMCTLFTLVKPHSVQGLRL